MKKFAFLFLTLSLAGCASSRYQAPQRPGDWSARLSAGASAVTVRTEEKKTFFGQPYVAKDSFSDTVVLSRLEVSTPTEDGWIVGAYADGGTADFGDHVSLGGIARRHLTEGLYAELRAGGRYSGLGEMTGFGLDAGAAVGFEHRGFFVQLGADYGTADLGDVDVSSLGGSLMMGVRF